VRNRIRALIVIVGIAALSLVVLAPVAHAQEEPGQPATTSEQAEPSHEAEECIEILEGGGEPDDCQEAPSPLVPEPNEIIWGSLAFLVLLVFFFWKGVPAVKNMEKAREDRIRGDLEAAESAKLGAQAEKTEYERLIADARTEAGTIIDEARQSAETVRRDLIARAETDAQEIRDRAQADIANQRNQAMAELRADVAQLSIDLAGRIVERNLDSDTNRQLVDSFIDQVGRSN
jgi:F-type H+-transporting ATPase subunit b